MPQLRISERELVKLRYTRILLQYHVCNLFSNFVHIHRAED